MSQPQMCSVCQSILVYLVLRADYLRGRLGLSCHPCRSPQTGSGPLPGPMCLLNCKRALWREKGGALSKWLSQEKSTLPRRAQDKQILADGGCL